MKKGIKLVFFLAGVSLLWGCYPQGPDYIEEMDIVVTKHNADYDFVAKSTYALPDRIVKITGDKVEGEEPEFMPDLTADKILAQIKENMDALGWTQVELDAPTPPDLLLLPAAWETTTVYYWYDYWYWWYGGYYPPYWGWGYPPVSYSSYTTGTLLMNLVDPDLEGSNGNPIHQWTGAINGILTSSYNASRVNAAIDKAFTISPYLKTN